MGAWLNTIGDIRVMDEGGLVRTSAITQTLPAVITSNLAGGR